MTYKLFGFLLLGITLLVSCNGTPVSLTNEGIMYAMIYDFDNVPVSAVAVYINDKRVVDSDIQGRFILDRMEKGEYSIKLIKRGYETLEEKFYYEPLYVLYFKMINTSQLVAFAETALDKEEFSAAENYINRALVIEPNRPDILFLKSITYYLQAKNDEAVEILENLIMSGNNTPSISQLLERIRQLQTPKDQ